MMNRALKNYFDKIVNPAARCKEIRRVAHEMGVVHSYVYFLCTTDRPLLVKWAIPIERATKGAVKRHELFPELFKGYSRSVKSC